MNAIIMCRIKSTTLVGISLLLLIVATMFVSPGWKHAHEGGEEFHTHHGSHSHSHNHSHEVAQEHKHDGDFVKKSASGRENHESRSHVHLSFLWFEFTLADVFNSSTEEVSHFPDVGVSRSSDSGEFVELRSPFPLGQLVQVLFHIEAIFSDRVCLLVADPGIFCRDVIEMCNGQLKETPPTPPPQVG